jgi:hypothetical protein
MVAPVYNVTTIKLVTAATTYNCYIQYNLVKQPPSVQPDFGDKLSKDRKPEVNS